MTAFIWGVTAAVRQLNQDVVNRALVDERGLDERQVIPDEIDMKRGSDRPHGEGGSHKRQKSHQIAYARCGKLEQVGRNCYFCEQPEHGASSAGVDFGLGLEERDGTTGNGKRPVHRDLVDRD